MSARPPPPPSTLRNAGPALPGVPGVPAVPSVPPPPPSAPSSTSILGSEKRSLLAHRDLTLRGSALPHPRVKPRATFAHGFLLPFSLIVATLRHPTLGLSYLRLTVVRALFVAVFAYVAFSHAGPRRGLPGGGGGGGGPRIVIGQSKPKHAKHKHHERARDDRAKEAAVGGAGAAPSAEPAGEDDEAPVHVTAPGVKVDIDKTTGEKKAVVLGKEIPIVDEPVPSDSAASANGVEPASAAPAAATAPAPATSWIMRLVERITSGWQWLAWFVGIVSGTEAVIVFFTRRWDDWLGHHASSLAQIRPEESTPPPPPKVAFDVRWLMRKLKRRIRGYLVFGAGIPLLALFRLVPGHLGGRLTIGDVLFTIALTCWGWYWLAVFTAGKSAHAWADAATAPSPTLIRELRDRSHDKWFLAPVHMYSRVWARVTRSMNAAAITFERTPRPYLGLALARAILALPGLYLLARPIVPIAAGRLCAESDPADRFSAPAPPASQPQHGQAAA
ncbi:MAG: hypothetical protein JST00_44020 [Deltaproteobacteria bacterium]|nr:hypothetical protein [Deltaproteobacteria bacterium]